MFIMKSNTLFRVGATPTPNERKLSLAFISSALSTSVRLPKLPCRVLVMLKLYE